MAIGALKRTANYLYLFPTQVQARRALWDSVDKQGRRVIDQAFPPELRETTRQDSMFIRLKNGSTIQVSGADNFDGLVGTNYAGIVFSEYAITSPQTWQYLSPILAENDGWVIFQSTPRGRNHLWKLYDTNKSDPNWYCQIASVTDTRAIPVSVIEADIRAGMPIEVAKQEYYCSFDAPNVGAVYRKELERAGAEHRITQLPYDPRHPVEAWFDIGHRDATAIWMVQRKGPWIDAIDYIEDRGKGLPFYANELAAKGYSFSKHVGPHDLNHKIWAADATTLELARNYGINFVVAPKLSIADGISAARVMFSRVRFDGVKCEKGLAALGAYEYEWDEDKRIYGDKPKHDWSSHGADAFRYGAVTPASIGVVPSWASDLIQHEPEFHRGQMTKMGRIGHNGGPPMDSGYDPLAAFR